MAGRFLFGSGLSALLILLAGCATHAPPPAGPAAAPPATGYKIGSPYQVNGVWYYPAEDWSYDETGIASWYGAETRGKYTANGEVFDVNGLTAAHRTLPMPSIVEVTNLDNGRQLKLRINDRGPFARGRLIDVSRRAAQLLGFEVPGTAKVRVKLLVPESLQAKLIAEGQAGGQHIEAASAAPVMPVSAEPLSGPELRLASSAPSPAAQPAPPAALPPPVAAPPPLPERVSTVAVRPSSIYIQAGAFSRLENAQRLKAKLDPLGKVAISNAAKSGIILYRVRIGPVGSVGEADQLLNRVVARGVPEARIVVD